jgi:uncharacterized coiled-coil protein SlyX
MSARKQIDELNAKVDRLRVALEKEQEDSAAHLRNIERLTIKASRTDDAEAALARTHEDRDTAWRTAARLEIQVADQNVTIVELAMERDTLIASLEAMAAEDAEAGVST